MHRNNRKNIVTGASDTRITPDLKALKAQFAAQRAAFAAEHYGKKEGEDEGERGGASSGAANMSERPIERTAKSRSRGDVSNGTGSVLEELVKKHRPASTREAADPRFSAMYGAFNKNVYSHAYSFIDAKEKEEQTARLDRFKKLRLAIKHLELEARGEDIDEYGVREQEEEVFEDDADLLRELLHTPVDRLRGELEGLKRQIDSHKSKAAQQASKERSLAARKRVMKAEVDAVKEGRKAKPFIPGRKDMRKAVEASRFDYLESVGGQASTNKFIEKKRVKKTNIR